MLNKFVFIGAQESPKHGRVRQQLVSKKQKLAQKWSNLSLTGTLITVMI